MMKFGDTKLSILVPLSNPYQYYIFSNSLSFIEDEQHPCRTSNITHDKIIEDKRAHTYVSGPKFEDSVPIPSFSPHNNPNYL